MVLRLTTKQLEAMREALLHEHKSVVRQFSDLHCSGYSDAGIKLCVRRQEIEALLDTLDQPQLQIAPPRMASARGWEEEVAA